MNLPHFCTYCYKVIYPCKLGPVDDKYYYCSKCDCYFLLSKNKKEFSLIIISRELNSINYSIYLLLDYNSSSIMWESVSNQTPLNQRWKGDRQEIKFSFLLPVTPDNIMNFLEHKIQTYITFS